MIGVRGLCYDLLRAFVSWCVRGAHYQHSTRQLTLLHPYSFRLHALSFTYKPFRGSKLVGLMFVSGLIWFQAFYAFLQLSPFAFAFKAFHAVIMSLALYVFLQKHDQIMSSTTESWRRQKLLQLTVAVCAVAPTILYLEVSILRIAREI